MQINFKSLLMASLILVSGSCVAQKTNSAKTSKAKAILTEFKSTDWFSILRDKTLNTNDVFKIENGVLQISGASSGYIRTQKIYSDFTMKLEWRWTKTAGNSGVMIHIQPKDSVWPACIQVQQKTNVAGDIICMNGLWAKECTDSVKFTVAKKLPSNEKPIGEWNTMVIISKKGTLKVFVNDQLQNEVSGLTATRGFIGFQNEGKPLEFRNVIIEE